MAGATVFAVDINNDIARGISGNQTEIIPIVSNHHMTGDTFSVSDNRRPTESRLARTVNQQMVDIVEAMHPRCNLIAMTVETVDPDAGLDDSTDIIVRIDKRRINIASPDRQIAIVTSDTSADTVLGAVRPIMFPLDGNPV